MKDQIEKQVIEEMARKNCHIEYQMINMISNKQIEWMTHEQVYQRYKEKKRKCKTVAQEIELITSDPEMIMLIERLRKDNERKVYRRSK